MYLFSVVGAGGFAHMHLDTPHPPSSPSGPPSGFSPRPGFRGFHAEDSPVSTTPTCIFQVQFLREKYKNLDIEVDGGVGPKTIQQCADVGLSVCRSVCLSNGRMSVWLTDCVSVCLTDELTVCLCLSHYVCVDVSWYEWMKAEL